jgi:hypothetical protein
MTEAEKVAASLTKADVGLFQNARTFPSGVWLGGPCKHLYPLNLCRLTGELTSLGLAVREIIKGNPDNAE